MSETILLACKIYILDLGDKSTLSCDVAVNPAAAHSFRVRPMNISYPFFGKSHFSKFKYGPPTPIHVIHAFAI